MKGIFALTFAFFALSANAAPGDITVFRHIFEEHEHSRPPPPWDLNASQESGAVGIRYGLTGSVSLVYGYHPDRTSDLASHIFALENAWPVHRLLDLGIMAGAASGRFLSKAPSEWGPQAGMLLRGRYKDFSLTACAVNMRLLLFQLGVKIDLFK